jgi:AN1-type zinc finger protein 2
MELDGLGARCALASCRAIDYLPITCASCAQPFCAEHATVAAHSCKLAAQQVQVPTCPICQRAVPTPAGGDPNDAMARHIDTGCPSRPRVNAVCDKAGCKVRDIAPVVCRACRGTFCMSHRLEIDHACAKAGSILALAAPATTAAAAVAVPGSGPKGNALAAAMRRLGVTSSSSPVTTSGSPPPTSAKEEPPERKQKKKLSFSSRSRSRSQSSPSPVGRSDGLAPLTVFQNSRTTPRGDLKIPEDQRMLFAVFYPVSMQRQPEWRFVNERHSAGKVLDELKLPELKEPGTRYAMHAVKPGFKGVNLLPLITPLRDVPKEILRDGDIVVVEIGEAALGQNWESALNSSKMTSSIHKAAGTRSIKCTIS